MPGSAVHADGAAALEGAPGSGSSIARTARNARQRRPFEFRQSLDMRDVASLGDKLYFFQVRKTPLYFGVRHPASDRIERDADYFG
jgi:hypothetical protein